MFSNIVAGWGDDSAASDFMIPRNRRQGDTSGKFVKFEAHKLSAESGNTRSANKKVYKLQIVQEQKIL